jgi:hypothetical protein
VERAREGYGVWLLQVLLPFDGVYLADVPVNAAYSERTSAHLKSLKEGATPYAGIDFKVGAQSAVARRGTAVSQIPYTGVRPVLVLALSRNAGAGRVFADSLLKKLQADPTLLPGKMTPADAFSAVELVPLAVAEPRFTEVGLLPREQQELDPAALAEFRLGPTAVGEHTASAEVTCGAKGQGWLVARYGQAPVVLPAYLRQEHLLQGPIDPLPPKVALAKPAASAERAFRLYTSCGPLGVRAEGWTMEYLLRTKVELAEKDTGDEWWSRGSASNSFEMPEKTYGLREVALALLRLRQGEHCAHRIRVTVKRTE